MILGERLLKKCEQIYFNTSKK